MYYKNRFVVPSYAVRVRCKKGTARIMKVSVIIDNIIFSTTTKDGIRCMNASGYMTR